MSIIWNKKNQNFKIHGHFFDKSELKTPKTKADIETGETGRINSLLVGRGREVQIHVVNKAGGVLDIATRPIGTKKLIGTWWKTVNTPLVIPDPLINVKL